ncbi:sulfotransferase [Maritimibacter sp. DP1N21-5]|uniref:sulfotransferase n=1 Tax=Maritimibacter sp. DP1N21-5 TaxID=2836867 RepID=UPI001C48A152|nr:sulfotransferase [Maritimibacter sp. DP1N21-5]MBV7410322.1 sulfotransferase domain-containing protein [Maritimibacter sp. DP1N21-5]
MKALPEPDPLQEDELEKRMLPSIVFVGPTKCGTTWIDSYLRSRSEVALPVAQKETFFFDKCFERGLDWYSAQWGDQSGIAIEVAPSLFHKPDARKNLAASIPDAKIIVVYRDPLDRAISHYFHYRKAGVPQASVSDMARAHPDIVEAGLFQKHASAWEALFPGRVFYLEYADLKSDPVAFCEQLCALIGIENVGLPQPAAAGRPVNAASIPRSAWVARLARRTSEALRRAGGHGVVNVLRRTRLKRLIFSGGAGIDAERSRVKSEINELKPFLEVDHEDFVSTRLARPAIVAAG